ncbi:uroporphyrinogen-III synthase [Ureibacillus thermosphaericus]|uniref:uroporphyrinogen-III synthase n=1 Tax=Ureibacillus thermosphaericus TaxID=51173 RepID=UPI0030C8EE52
MGNLHGKRIAITGSRKSEEISTLIRKKGGEPVIRAIQETIKCSPSALEAGLRSIVEKGTDWAVFTTGIGTNALLEAAEKIGILDSFINVLKEAKIAARGYKTKAALKQIGIQPDAADDDGTNDGLLRAIEGFSFKDKHVFLQLHGEPVPKLSEWFEKHGAILHEILPYRSIVPNPETVEQLLDEIIENKLNAVAFTAAPQVRVLFKLAEKKGATSDLIEAFQQNVLAAAVGKVTAGELKEYGVQRIVAPELERMGAMIVALDEYFQ